jgi:ankyrin repeat protein
VGLHGRIGPRRDQPIYDGVGCFGSNGLAAAGLNGKWGLIDRNQRFVMPAKFDEVGGNGDDSYVPVRLNGKWGYADIQGNLLIPPTFDEVNSFSRWDRPGHKIDFGLASVKTKGKHGAIDRHGNFVIAPKYDYWFIFDHDGFAQIHLSGVKGFIDIRGRKVSAEQVARSRAAVSSAKFGGLLELIDRTGKLVVVPTFHIDGAPRVEGGLIRVNWHGGGYIDVSGQVVAMPIQGCGAKAIIGRGNAVIWPPQGVDPKVIPCILLEYAVADFDPAAIKALKDQVDQPRKDAALLTASMVGYPAEMTEAARKEYFRRQVESVKALVAVGANPSARNKADSPALMLAVQQKGPEDAALALIELGADVNARGCSYFESGRACETTPMLHWAFRLKKDRLVRAMLAHKADPNITDFKSATLLSLVLSHNLGLRPRKACKSAKSDGCARQEPEEPPKAFDRKMWVKMLLDHGADPNKPSNGMPPLVQTTQGEDEVVQMLVAAGAKMAPPLGKSGEMGPMVWSLQNDRDDLLQIALSQSPQQLDALDQVAIGLAVKRRNKPDLVQALLSRGANPNLLVTPKGGPILVNQWKASRIAVTPLHLAAEAGKVEVARVLIRGGADVNAQTTLTANLVDMLTDYIPMPHGQRWDDIDSDITPLMEAARHGSADMVKLLLESGADVSAESNKGYTARKLARTEEVRRLLDEARARRSWFRW